MSDDRRVEILQQVLGAFNAHDLDAIMEHFGEDCVFESPRGSDRWGSRFVGKGEVRRGLAARFEGIPDVSYGDDDHFASGNRGVSEWTITGTTVIRRANRRAGLRSVDVRGRREDRPQGQLLEDPRALTGFGVGRVSAAVAGR